MAQKAYSLSHTKWMCKYHIVFTPKYRRKVIYSQIRTTLKKGGLLLGYNPRAPGSRLKARARTSSRPSAS